MAQVQPFPDRFKFPQAKAFCNPQSQTAMEQSDTSMPPTDDVESLSETSMIDGQRKQNNPSTLLTQGAQEQSDPMTSLEIPEALYTQSPSSAPGDERSDESFATPAGTWPPSEPSFISPPSNEDAVSNHIPNIVIFGEAGVGKSSVINLVAGEKLADVSNDALGCTFEYKNYTVKLGGKVQCALWDTTGLDEGSKGKVPADVAEDNLRKLISDLAYSGGIHLVIYCIRGTRLTTALKRNYDLFYVTACRKKVPVALVVTNLEHQEGAMETWWDANEAVLRSCEMWFDTHACVTTLDIDDPIIQERRSNSQGRLRDLLIDYSGRRPWKINSSLLSRLFLHLRRLPTLGKNAIRRVVVFDRNARPGEYTRLIGGGDRQYEYEYVNIDTSRMSRTSYSLYGLGAGVLVFYTSALSDGHTSSEDMDALKIFYDIVSGEMCPLIIVLRDCNNEEGTRRCKEAITSQHADIRASYTLGGTELDEMIERYCIPQDEANKHLSRLYRIYSGRYFGEVVSELKLPSLFVS